MSPFSTNRPRNDHRGVDLISDALPVRSPLTLTLFALAFFSRRQDRELLGAISRGLLDCPCRL